ncbi:MAG: LarC family nickel insertion protein, partial [Verrucomicrobiota bacterium]
MFKFFRNAAVTDAPLQSMKILYLDIFSGISGDMFIGAMLDLGVDFHQLEHELQKLHLHGYHLHTARKQKSQIEGVKFDVHLAHDHDHHREDEHAHEHIHSDGTKHSHSHSHAHGHEDHHHEHGNEHEHHHDEHEHEHGRNFSEIKKLIRDSALSSWVKEKSIAVFQRIAVAEGKIHGMPPEEVHFHEVGAVDSIVDIVGACIVVEMLGKPKILASNVTEGTGWINCAHGRFPIPAPATLAIFADRKIPITQCDEPHELVTPTGAALLAEFVETFGPMQNLAATRIGFGLGTRDNKTRPNVLRAILCENELPAGRWQHHAETTNDWQTDTISVLETNLDDINSEIL